MDFLLLLLIFAVFALPTLLLSRSNRRRVEQAQQMQAAVKPGDRIVTVSGFHGTVVSGAEATVELEIAPGVVVTMERAGVLRVEEPVAAPNAGVGANDGELVDDGRASGYDGDADYGDTDHPETRRA